ncbi:MAG: DUF296 domain-containing protein [Bacilli bacterium]|nr:DUF296 domain-containing protein [Bacilli bacterium]
MDYRNFDNVIYLRLDKGDEVLSSIVDVCQKEGVRSCVFSGIGGCDYVKLGTFMPERGTYNEYETEGMLELISLNGDIKDDDGEPLIHAHACLSYEENGQIKLTGGHLLALRVLITAEIEIRPVNGGLIKTKPGQIQGTKVWDFE